MKNLVLKPLVTSEEKEVFVKEIQEAFQSSYEAEYGKYEKTILPTEDIEESFAAKGSEAYLAKVGDRCVGGAIVVIDKETNCASLDLLYVKTDSQNSGCWFKIWDEIEKMYPEIMLMYGREAQTKIRQGQPPCRYSVQPRVDSRQKVPVNS